MEEKVFLLEGDYIPVDEVVTARWKSILDLGLRWTDEVFPPAKRSLEGDGDGDGAATDQSARWADLTWERFPQHVVVTNAGFSATDLRQGRVGDCWFLSAVAVVAERHDLIARLFADTVRNPAGCYCMQLFLDGDWRAILVDDQFPATNNGRNPSMAFSRAANDQLWVPLLEKAFAKAHGSYRAIVGGKMAEALLDLTGAPVFTVEFDHPGFTLDALWAQLVYFKSLKFPMGCATAPDPNLSVVGLVSNHAYSLLECREVKLREGGGGDSGSPASRTRQAGAGYVRLVRLRNPHGAGEWKGEWSDASASWSRLLSSTGLERTGTDDGTFWMDLTHFCMSFRSVDVCFAFPDWHARSLANKFCWSSSPWRVCQHVYRVRASQPTLLYLLALQPTQRGAWCRADRKKSYRLGDVSLFVARLDAGGNVAEVVGGGLQGAASRCTFVATLDSPASDYLVIPYNLGAAPSGAEVAQAQPFAIRFFASAPLVITQQQFQEGREQDRCHAMAAFHRGLQFLVQGEQERQQQQGVPSTFGAGGGVQACGYGPHAIVRPHVKWGCWRLMTWTRTPRDEVDPCVMVLHVSMKGVLAYLAVNRGLRAVHVEVCADVRGMIARGSDGSLLLPDESAAAELNPTPPPGAASPPQPPDSSEPIAKKVRFRNIAAVAVGEQRLVMLVVAQSPSHELSYSAKVVVVGENTEANGAGPAWLPHSLFSSMPSREDLATLLEDTVNEKKTTRSAAPNARPTPHDTGTPGEDAALAAALAASIRDISGVPGNRDNGVAVPATISKPLRDGPSSNSRGSDDAEDALLALALAESAREAQRLAEPDKGARAGNTRPSPSLPSTHTSSPQRKSPDGDCNNKVSGDSASAAADDPLLALALAESAREAQRLAEPDKGARAGSKAALVPAITDDEDALLALALAESAREGQQRVDLDKGARAGDTKPSPSLPSTQVSSPKRKSPAGDSKNKVTGDFASARAEDPLLVLALAESAREAQRRAELDKGPRAGNKAALVPAIADDEDALLALALAESAREGQQRVDLDKGARAGNTKPSPSLPSTHTSSLKVKSPAGDSKNNVIHDSANADAEDALLALALAESAREAQRLAELEKGTRSGNMRPST